MAYVIPKNEYFERIAKFQANIKAAGLDALIQMFKWSFRVSFTTQVLDAH